MNSIVQKMLATIPPALIVLVAGAVLTTSPRAQEVAVAYAAECPATGPAFIICTGALVVISEFFVERPFGPNGEIAKVLDIDPSEWFECGLKQQRAGSLTAKMNFGLRPPTCCFTPNLI